MDDTHRDCFPLAALLLFCCSTTGGDWEVLRWSRLQPEFRALPVVIFSGSANPDDEKKAPELGANAYHIKPQNLDEFIQVIGRIAKFWLPSSASGLARP